MSRENVVSGPDIALDSDIGGGPFMCARCESDRDLKQFIRDNLVSPYCDFCYRESRRKLIAAEAELVGDRVYECVRQDFEDAAMMVPYESREGGYQGPVTDSYDLLCEEAELDPAANEKAFQYLVDHIPDHPWAQKHFFSLTPDQVWRFGWEGFVNAVKHHNRYLFFPRRKKSQWPDEEGIRPERMLAELGGAIRNAGLVRKLRAGTLLFRVRTHKAHESPTTLAEFGATAD
ncbi:MAG: HEPN-associated N-terminal domain-containing protein [Gemmatimonadaceae bacterium]